MATEAKNKKAEEAADVTMSKEQLDGILSQLEQQRKQIEDLSKSQAASGNTVSLDKTKELELLELVKRENEKASELVDVYVDKGSMKSNKNLEVNANGVQYIIPKGEPVKVPRAVKEIIDNSEKQMAKALDLQYERANDAIKASNEGGI